MKFNEDELIKSPLNYTGGKFKLLPQILPLFPDEIDIFVDLFAGGLDVSINVKANKIISNDIITPLISLYDYFKETNTDLILIEIENAIEKYKLSKENLEGYLNLRLDYNKSRDIKLLFPLIAYCYNNQIRFNSKFEFNRHFGKNRSSFNSSMKSNLIKFLKALKEKDIKFYNRDVLDMKKVSQDKNKFFVYIDPLI